MSLTSAIRTLRDDVRAIFRNDPAAHSLAEVILYPGLHAILLHRLAHALWLKKVPFLPRYISQVSRFWSGIEIHPGATIGDGLFIDHGMGVVIGETAEIGDDVTLYHGVTLGGTTLDRGTKRHPTVRDRVVVGAGAKVLGALTVGEDSKIGANAVLLRSVPEDSVVVGVPGQVIASSGPHVGRAKPEVGMPPLSDPVGLALQSVMVRVDRLEKQLHGHTEEPALHMYAVGVWETSDFSI